MLSKNEFDFFVNDGFICNTKMFNDAISYMWVHFVDVLISIEVGKVNVRLQTNVF